MLWNVLLCTVSAKVLEVIYKRHVSKKPLQTDAFNQAALMLQAFASVNDHDPG